MKTENIATSIREHGEQERKPKKQKSLFNFPDVNYYDGMAFDLIAYGLKKEFTNKK